MRLSDFIIDIGRMVAYYPNLKKITDSTTATIMLCQFLYWCGKTKDDDGWIYKTSEEIEEETGLTYYEQKTAKELLVEKGLLEQERRRLEHTSRYRVNQDKINSEWERVNGRISEGVAARVAQELFPTIVTSYENPVEGVTGFTIDRTAKKGDLVDLAIATMVSPAMKKEKAKDEIKIKLEKKFKINVDNKKWADFIEFVYNRQEKNKESVDIFIKWALENGFNPIYWTPEKMKTLYPQAFAQPESGTLRDDFVQKLPEVKEEEYAPMPKTIGIKRDVT